MRVMLVGYAGLLLNRAAVRSITGNLRPIDRVTKALAMLLIGAPCAGQVVSAVLFLLAGYVAIGVGVFLSACWAFAMLCVASWSDVAVSHRQATDSWAFGSALEDLDVLVGAREVATRHRWRR